MSDVSFEPVCEVKSQSYILDDTGMYTGQKLLDFGCGPVIDHAISPSRYFEEIYFADFKTNLDQIKKWVNRSPDAFDWSHFFKLYAELEG